MKTQFSIRIDVGSTTVKAVVVEADTGQIVWRDYQRHDSRQPEVLLDFLCRLEKEAKVSSNNARIFITGSGGNSLASLFGAKFVQEVNAVALAVERLHPEVNSVVELGGQDAKIIIFRDDTNSGRKRKIPTMNDKCAGGTGAVIDKIAGKLKISPEQLRSQPYSGIRLHQVAGKCGVFAETDINSLQKQGVSKDELMASLFDAIVLQNMTVLTRGNTLRPQVLLLGGPNVLIRGMREAWQHNLEFLWKERQIELPPQADLEDLIKVPENALHYAALGAIEFGKMEPEAAGRYLGTECLSHYVQESRQGTRRQDEPGLISSQFELLEFRNKYSKKPFVAANFSAGSAVRAFIGIDAGSTSTKAVLLSESCEVLCKAYQLSCGDPIQDAKQLFESLRQQVESQEARLEILGVGTTGYAKNMLHDALCADVALVETVAHTQSALHYYKDPHCIVDVGGQDIKIIVLRNRQIKDFRLNTQCSAGNGYFLQSTAQAFGVPIERFADAALSAESMPTFGYGCAIFLQSDIVNFQRSGWHPEEILAGLAAVLPKNIFLYVANVPNVQNLGTSFVLQGGTQNNLAVVKAEVDFIRNNFGNSETQPEIVVHPHCGEAGAIGAAMEAKRLYDKGQRTTFIGLDAVRHIRYRTARGEETRCHFCTNRCLRTFLDIQTASHDTEVSDSGKRRVPLGLGERRVIIAGCEKGSVEDLDRMREIKAGLDAVRATTPNLVDMAAHDVWKSRHPALVRDAIPAAPGWRESVKRRIALMKARSKLRVGIPRVLNMWVYASLFSAYLESLGISSDNIVYSDFTTNEMYRAGSSRGSIDPCFPSKIAIAHFHNLIFSKHARRPLDCIFLPMFDVLCSPLVRTRACNACPTAAVTPETVEAAYTKEINVFAENNIRYLHPIVNLSDKRLFEQQMFECWGPVLGLSAEENHRAVQAGYESLASYERDVRRRARTTLDMLEHENRLGIVMLGRPYHHDPGLNHGIPEEFQKFGYPVFSQSTLPLDDDLLDRLFGDEVRAGIIGHPLEISDVWKTATAASSNLKIWAAKFTARHPNLVAVELSNFKCGHDAPVYSVVERIIEQSGTPYFCFKDLDENKPVASIRLRVETIDYFLKSYCGWTEFSNQVPPMKSDRYIPVSQDLLIPLSVQNANEPLEAIDA